MTRDNASDQRTRSLTSDHDSPLSLADWDDFVVFHIAYPQPAGRVDRAEDVWFAAWLGELSYQHDAMTGSFDGKIEAAGASLCCSACPSSVDQSPRLSPAESLAEFLLGRYTAFTYRHRVRRRFAVRHAPWPQTAMTPRIGECGLLDQVGPWFRCAELCSAQASPGVKDVVISRPGRC